MSGTLQLGGTNLAVHSGSGASAKITLDSGLVFPAGAVIGFKFLVIDSQTLSGTYAKFNINSAATASQGLQVVSTTYDPKSNNSLIYVTANLIVTETANLQDEAYAAIFVETTNLSQTAQINRTSNDKEYTVANLSGTFTNSATSQLTVQVRASGDTNQSLYINPAIGDVSYVEDTSRYFKTGLTIMEIQQ